MKSFNALISVLALFPAAAADAIERPAVPLREAAEQRGQAVPCRRCD